MDWTEETISRLRGLWQEGLSTAEIGRRMSITKNAVVGKAHRLTLPPRPSPIRKGQAPIEAGSRPAPSRASRVTPFVPRPAAVKTAGNTGDLAQASITPLHMVATHRPKPDPLPLATVPQEPRAAFVSSAQRPASQPSPRRYGQSCCWPLGDPGTKQFRFCGGEPVPGKPYCGEHAQLAYVKLRDRRDTVA